MTEHDLPSPLMVRAECELIEHVEDVVALYECSDEAIGCSVEEWYPEFEEGIYLMDAEYDEVLDHTESEEIANAFAIGYLKGEHRSKTVPVLPRKHDPQL